ncbi:MAG: bifunctional rhamnulose-1-phosphate aldolase/short-chain dehydrogenase [Planctomycetes bacterium]|nr:bifunctional rhamnulose-1-phosphate aldolase/short-chain dehydrogenase [Planctomycetota bacterium]
MSAQPATAPAAISSKPYPAWDAAHAATLDAVGRLIYRSNLLGSDQRVTNTGGGNTSAKISERDPLSASAAEVLWVKGSGGDLRTSKAENFASLYQGKLVDLQRVYAAMPDQGLKSPAEDRMVAMYPHCTFNLNPRATSIDTPLHAFVPHKHVDHMHPNSVIAIAAAKNSKELTKKVFGDDLVWMPWQRPGFDLGLQLQALCAAHPSAKGAIMGGHGAINWADEDRACYDLTIDIIKRADDSIAACDKGDQTFGGQQHQALDPAKRRAVLTAVLPWLRGQVSRGKRLIATVQDDATMLRFVCSADAPRLAGLGTSCPDHFLRTKIKPLYVGWDPAKDGVAALKERLAAGMERYRAEYAAYYQRCKRPDSPAMRDANPTVILIPGVGMVTFGKDKSESRVTAEFYNCAVEVMRGAEAMDSYVAIAEQEAFDIEYWLLEEAKLKRMPPEKELARQVICVIGAGSGIGKEVAHRLIKEGAHIVAVDMNPAAAQATAKELTDRNGVGIGVGGTGVSACGPAIGLSANITDRASIRAMLDEIILAYGGIDQLILTAGITVPADAQGRIPDDKWGLTFDINVIGQAFAAEETAAVMDEQGLSGSITLTTSANAVVAKKGMLAYDTSKAAAEHLVRELAVTLAPRIRVNAVAPATVVQGSAMFPRDRVLSSLAKYAIAFDPSESDDQLRAKLANFYAGRTLLKASITPADQAEAFFILASNRLGKTTGQIINVDGGLHEAFHR